MKLGEFIIVLQLYLWWSAAHGGKETIHRKISTNGDA